MDDKHPSEPGGEPPVYVIRGQRVIFSRTLAELLGVATQDVNRMIVVQKASLPNGAAFQLTKREVGILFARGVLLPPGRGGGTWHLPWVLTEQAVADISNRICNRRQVTEDGFAIWASRSRTKRQVRVNWTIDWNSAVSVKGV